MATASLRRMAVTGLRDLRRHAGLAAALYGLQLAASTLAGFAVARALAAAFAERPAIDGALDGDLLRIALLVRDNLPLFAGAFWTCLSFVILYAVVSWFTTAGLIATFLDRPLDRRQTASAFGAGGAANALPFARLWLWSLLPYAAAAMITLLGLGLASGGLENALDAGDLLWPLAAGAAPGAIVWWIVNTSVDFARIDLVRRQRKSALRALLRGFADAVTDWRPLPHAAIFYLLIIAPTAVYLTGVIGVELTALGLLLLRQLVAVFRFAAKVWLISGQVELAASRNPPRD